MHNLLLAALPAADRGRLFPQLEMCSLSAGQVLYEAAEPTQYVYFPIDAITCLVQLTDSGASCASAIVGHEGMVGVSLFLGSDASSSRAMVYSAGYAYRLSGIALREEFRRSSVLQQGLLRYTQLLFTQMAQTALCNRHHTVDQQLCRLLLLTIDRLPVSELKATHDLIAGMLGVRREGVSTAAHALQTLGIIRNSRGLVQVLDRPALEVRACECYAVVKRESDRLAPLLGGQSVIHVLNDK
jgi:CRP-like cAMP-binding protein